MSIFSSSLHFLLLTYSYCGKNRFTKSFARSQNPMGGRPRAREGCFAVLVKIPAQLSNPTLVEYAGE
jgi:hypothetical protein